jgi:D-proline reductase (dithiol) PrdB
MNFLDVERDYVRRRALPDFEWTPFELPTEPNPLNKPLRDCKVALVATSGAYLHGKQEPFLTKSKLGDDSFRVIPKETAPEEIGIAHPGYDTQRALLDLDCVFPYLLLNRLKGEGSIGEVAPKHFSFMGYVPKPEGLIWRTAPQVGRSLLQDRVDLVILVPS